MKIENFGDLSEYVENQNEVLKILEGYDFDIKYVTLLRNENDNVPMYNYNFNITNVKTGVTQWFDYSEGIGNEKLNDDNKLNKIINALWCIISDFMCYYMDFDEFVDTFGYGNEEVKVVMKIWNKIKENNQKLLDLMSEEDIELLRDDIQL